MGNRRSVLTWSDCQYLQRKMHKVSEELMKFATNGLQETGLRDDQFAIIEIYELSDLVNKIIERSKKVNG